ncbi:helix-turn-helix domain-containing protein [Kitasatospora sp. NPDC002040]|uniref:TetR/AcrR family transcriptional regulator n=1 Tax=Kitasatospora sp. NPDC002040 TaxID=3154661 RepID=UPI0033248554
MSGTAFPRPRVGRPRAAGPSSSELSPREQVLAAAAELFTRNGYAATTTRAVAELAGLRQASMYHYFARKEDLLATLLESTVEPSLAFARTLLDDPGADPAAALWALARYDSALLFGGLYNLGALYQLPEVRGERFAEFRRARAELRSAYRELLTRMGPVPELELRTDLLVGLLEGGVAATREDPDRTAAEVAPAVADAALRLAGCPAERIAAARTDAARTDAVRGATARTDELREVS